MYLPVTTRDLDLSDVESLVIERPTIPRAIESRCAFHISSRKMRDDLLTILIVEDDPHDALLLASALNRQLEAPHECLICATLNETEAAMSSKDIGLVITDLSLPDSNGLVTFEQVASLAGAIPVVILTGNDSTELAMECVRAGAQDFVTKGDMTVDRLIQTVQFAIERSKRLRAERERDAAAHDSIIARRIQESLYPKQSPIVDGIEIAGATFPASEACGDYFDFFQTDEKHVAIALGDVCGHGLTASMTMMQLHACLRLLAMERWPPEKLLAGVNTAIVRDVMDSAPLRFATLFFAELCVDSNQISYASAGHQSFILRNDGSTEVLDATGIPVGLDQGSNTWDACVTELLPGDTLLIPTDGFMEAMNGDRALFGQDRVLEIAHQCGHQPLDDLISTIRSETLDFMADEPIKDDMTLVAVRNIGHPAKNTTDELVTSSLHES